jgi:hypothetical protein
MPAYPDRDTLRLRAPDRRTPAEAVALTARELARRPAATPADVRLAPADRALVSFRERYPGVAERFAPAVLWAAAHGPAPQPAGKVRRPCAWCMARVWARRPDVPVPTVDKLGRLLLGDPCLSCQAALGWHPPRPKPKPKPKPRARSRSSSTARARTSGNPARSSTSGRVVHLPASRPQPSPDPAASLARAVVAAAFPDLTAAERARYNRAALARLGIPADRARHLTGGG